MRIDSKTAVIARPSAVSLGIFSHLISYYSPPQPVIADGSIILFVGDRSSSYLLSSLFAFCFLTFFENHTQPRSANPAALRSSAQLSSAQQRREAPLGALQCRAFYFVYTGEIPQVYPTKYQVQPATKK